MAGELRITGGSFARRRIKVPAAADKGGLRPTSDKVRAAIMNAIAAELEGARVVDVFAGSGALGFEALSRGAVSAVFVEKDARTMRTIEANAAELGVGDACEFELGDAMRGLSSVAAADVAFVDPPYAYDVDEVLRELVAIVRPGGIVVLERDKRSKDELPTGLDVERDRVYGDTRVVVLRRRQEVAVATAAIYPGSFDPMTNGHIDIIQRGVSTFDKVIVAVANNPQKSPLFSVPERLELAREVLRDVKGVEIDTFDGLIIEYAQKKGVHTLLRGLRAVSDFEYEFQLASMNRKLAKDVETVFMMTSEASFYLSSRLVREVAEFGGDVGEMVPPAVYSALKKKFARKK